MKKKNYIYIGIGIAIIAIIIPLSMLNFESEPLPETISDLDVTYQEANSILRQKLETHGISMSSPINLINKNTLNEFCSFFSDEIKQQKVEFCTSTELLDSEGNYLGNIHMVGSRSMPKIVLAVAQTNPFMENLDQIKLVYEETVDLLVCDCWEDFEPSGFKTVSEWVDKQREFHASDTRPTSASSVDIKNKNLQMELSTNTDGYQWSLVITG